MKPAIFISTSVLVGLLFAFQEWLSIHHMGYHLPSLIFFESWGYQFLVWGTLCWLLWHFFGSQIQNASTLRIISVFLPLSVVISLAQQMLFVFIFRELPLNHPETSYWHRLSTYVYAELLDNMLIFWCAFFLFRGVGYYQRFREHETTKAELEVQLANAQLAALRMQLNPHFLFNTMNGISSLMRSDIEAADNMLEQLSCLLRMSLERGDSQLITLREELEFVELYLAMQGHRYSGRVKQSVHVDPQLYDSLIPSMLLQPIVENAYVHGLSRIEATGTLMLEVHRHGKQIRITVVNSGIGMNPASYAENGHGVGLRNIKNRLKLHYGEDSHFEIAEVDPRHVRVDVELPLRYSNDVMKPAAKFGR
ncbi:histidine kinase [Telmatobacter sp. DSM 110680]|uniref:Histidine kinase n=1 Tax=Telmatobacter sp. DSM 110680 TaxID=3036704 RepID=A0AAU7DKP2_9BACT